MKTLQDLVNSLENRPFIAASWRDDSSKRKEIDSQAMFERVVPVASGLRSLGLAKGDKVALFADNNPYWLMASLGINYAGLVDVPRGSDTTDDEFRYILEHSDAAAIVVQNKNLFERAMKIKPKHIDLVFSLEQEEEHDLNYLYHLGLQERTQLDVVQPDELASIIYTSGTTGEPKGVMISHNNYVSNVVDLANFLGDISQDKFISILPPWHVFGRGEKHLALLGGSEMFYSTVKTVVQDLQKEQPTMMVSVPRLWESVYNKFNANPKVQKIEKIPLPFLRTKLKSMGIKKALGGNMRLIVSGGGGLPEHIDNFFIKHGVQILEGYGMTEMSPVISAREIGSGYNEMGTVGKPIGDVQVQIRSLQDEILSTGQEGIIYVNGPNRMLGYYKRPQETAQVIGEDGFLNTGDLGYQRADGNIVISGRQKNEIVLSNGENVQPERLEELISANSYVEQVMVVGEHWDEQKQKNVSWQNLGALVVPKVEQLQAYVKETFNKDVSLDEVLHLKEAKDFIHDQVKQLLSEYEKLKPFEKISSVYLVDAFEVGRELTQTFKLRRNEILRNLRKDEIYALSLILA